MSGRPAWIWRNALSYMSVRLVVEQIALAAVVFLLFVTWLRVPDASGFDIAITVLLALLMLAVAGCGEAAIVLRLCARERSVQRLLLGAGLLVAAVALWFGWSALIEHVRGNDFERASYYNSQLPHQLRYFFTYEHILLWLGWMWSTLTWVGAGVLALGVACGTASARPARAMIVALRSMTFWLTLLIGVFASVWVTSSLIGWMPGHGLRKEMLSVALRLGVAILFDVVTLCLLLAVIAACCRRTAGDEAQAIPAGTPDLSQPRTEGSP